MNQDPNEYTVTAAGNVYSRPKSSRPMVGMPDDPSSWRPVSPLLELPAVDPRSFMERMVQEQLASIPVMTQEDFADRVTRRMDRDKDMQKILREKFGVNSIIEGIQRGVFPTPPRGI